MQPTLPLVVSRLGQVQHTMRIFAKLGCLYFDGQQHQVPCPSIKVIDLQTGAELRWCQIADSVTGEFERFISKPEPLRSRGWMDEKDEVLQIPKRVQGVTKLRIEVSPCPNPSCKICGRICGVHQQAQGLPDPTVH